MISVGKFSHNTAGQWAKRFMRYGAASVVVYLSSDGLVEVLVPEDFVREAEKIMESERYFEGGYIDEAEGPQGRPEGTGAAGPSVGRST